ncbi:bifunctional diaminohydroxyphosphoribosylaminopyrimidine deaminase/5-amino-6-(5-phosphoribosylamino)uracil reductase RibD [Umboniibacter marinipuniceus]|uniref:Riboflavin biosynthesis protein RibD n=1 Tax=Umboniibacter marinipuniceus TaxID=569599 RepID=A0A3M0AB75_9GAMM|nr:bifunctional diaminohydroxyphosphoribosylaminopyrimidine deaminase/5-amino-6-(5-phosphoribosylamino)uracil reductase RibD [Umboniibacter marinipuniceus]RMA82401.1 diaminohydroxyphosphoribosylaminopyrimidine deaminase/5-amino-6-(5-phosphoribosylamino)uracil reductase [Umboniibacter marinipuniceus]
MDTADHKFMSRAIQIARQGRFITRPNPSVGCLLVVDGEVVGEGHTQPAGGLHAERVALAAAAKLAAGATAYVSLEPCSHTGRTSPCADALIEAGVSRVVFAGIDPHEQVAGAGLDKLRLAGIRVDGPLMQPQAEAINPGFLKRARCQLPFVVMKSASSVDGRTAMASGESKWITGPAARADVQKLRALSSAIITGVDSVLQDDSRLTLRREELTIDENSLDWLMANPPLRVVLDSHGRLSADAAICRGEAPTLWITGTEVDRVISGVERVSLPLENGRLPLLAVLELLAQRQCNQVLVEAGPTLSGAFLAAGLVDCWYLYMAPKLLGSSANPLLRLPFEKMSESVNLDIAEVRTIGDDLRFGIQLAEGAVCLPV